MSDYFSHIYGLNTAYFPSSVLASLSLHPPSLIRTPLAYFITIHPNLDLLLLNYRHSCRYPFSFIATLS